MNLLVVGASYRTTPVSLLERLAVPPAGVSGLLSRLLAQDYVREAVILSTCNRVEVYAEVTGFHGGLADVCAVLGRQAGTTPAELAPHLYVYFSEAAVDHTFRVASGLDSMVVGEAQILGQLRDAYHLAVEHDSAGRLLHELMQQALRVGKRAHAETGIDRAGQSVVSAALEVAAAALTGVPLTGTDPTGQGAGDPASAGTGTAAGPAGVVGLAGRPALVVGAGAMGALAVATLSRVGAAPVAVTNRSADRAARLAATYDATHVPIEDLVEAVARADVVVAATAAVEPVLDLATVREAMRVRADRRPGPLVILDLAVPRDVHPAAGKLPGVRLIDIEGLAATVHGGPAAAESAAVEEIVATEVEAFLTWVRGTDAAPTVAALRARADDVVAAELRRLGQRRPDLTEEQRADVAHTIHRVVQRLLHQPTVRVRKLAAEPGGDQYTALLRELFDLKVPHTTTADAVPELEERER